LADVMGQAKEKAAIRAKGRGTHSFSVSSGGIPAVRWL
jgi:hypothetical protein